MSALSDLDNQSMQTMDYYMDIIKDVHDDTTQSMTTATSSSQATTSFALPQLPLPLLGGGEGIITGRPPAILYLTCDHNQLSEYQCLVRKQIELFEAKHDDVESNAQGRNRPVQLGQVGIRCHHCAKLPPKLRVKGATYYPAKLDGIYQAAQNMAKSHLLELCPQIPPETRQELLTYHDQKTSSSGGGKKYWAERVRILGVYEDADVLRYTSRIGDMR